MGSSSSCPEDNSGELSLQINELHDNLEVQANKNEENEKLITSLEHRILNDYFEKQRKPPVFANAFTGLPKQINNIPHGGSRRTRRKVRKSGKPKKSRKNRSRK